MDLKIDVACPQGHSYTVSMEGMPNVTVLNVGNAINVNVSCPICGESPLKAPGGYYEPDAEGLMRRVGDYRPDA